MSTAFYLTIIWFSITLLVLTIEKYYKVPFLKLNDRQNILLLAFEVLAISIAIYFNDGKGSSPYFVLIASFLFLVGWINSHQNLLFRLFKGSQKRTWLQWINLFFEGSPYVQNIYFVGDWLQIVAIALVWNSIASIAICCVIYPAVAYILSEKNTRNFNKTSDQSEHIKNEAWGYVMRFLARSFIAILLLVGLFAISQRDLTIFFGTIQDATNLITTLAQVETTVFALVITFLFLLVEFTNAAYSPRLVKSFFNHWSFRQMVSCAVASIVIKFLLIANLARYVNLGNISNTSEVVDWALLFTILSVLSYIIFIRIVINLMQPEAIAYQILNEFVKNG